MTRTSTLIDWLEPTRSNSRSCSTRSSLACSGQRHVADLVQEDRALVGHLEAADALSVGAGERALFVAEQLALHQRRRQRRQVDLDQRPFGVGRVLVQHLGHRFLARAGLADDQHVGVEAATWPIIL